jgi:N-acetylmuramoyl-L-alanine amidase
VPDRFLQKWDFNGEQMAYSDRFKGHSIFVSHDNGDYRGSVQFAQMLGQRLKDRGLKYTPHYTESFMGSRRRILVDADAGVYRYDQLIVLRSTRIPAVLLEAGSIINRDEELAMATPERRGIISAAAVDAVESFCEARSTQVASAPQPAASRKVLRAGMRTPASRR